MVVKVVEVDDVVEGELDTIDEATSDDDAVPALALPASRPEQLARNANVAIAANPAAHLVPETFRRRFIATSQD